MTSQQNSATRVVVSGLGVISPIGIGAAQYWEALAAGTSGVGKIDRLAYTALPQNVGAEAKEFTDTSAKKVYLKGQRKSIKVMCREIQLGVAAALMALENSHLDADQIDHTRLGVEFGANQMLSPPNVLKEGCYSSLDDDDQHFSYERWGTSGLGGMEPLWLLKYLPNMPACHIGIAADARGPNNSLTLSEASGNLVMGEAFRIIARGDADMMIVGTTGNRIHPVKCMHAAMWEELAESDAPVETWPRPFELHRTGQVIGEGAATFIFEKESLAQSRGANILGTLLGAGSSCVVDRKGHPNIRLALVNAMRTALNDAGLSPSDVGHINAHGLGTKQGDIDEAAAIHDVFGSDAETVPVTALKSTIGNSGAGCGTLELAASLLGLKHGVVPATLNYDEPDPECPLNVVHGQPSAISNKIVLNINVTNIGQASALVVCGA